MRYDDYFVNILDIDTINHTHWAYVIERDTQPEIEKANVIEIDARVSKQDYDGTFIKPKKVFNDKGEPADGNIYHLIKKAGRQE